MKKEKKEKKISTQLKWNKFRIKHSLIAIGVLLQCNSAFEPEQSSKLGTVPY